MRGEWVTTKEAATIIGCSNGQVAVIARRKGWKIKLIPRTTFPYGHPIQTFRRDYVKRYAEEKAKRKLRSYKQSKKTSVILKLVEWIDGLDHRPTDEEIMEHTSFRYRYQDVVSVIENRERRDTTFSWEKLPGGEENVDQSDQRETTVCVGASN